jgi:hypothetical protein
MKDSDSARYEVPKDGILVNDKNDWLDLSSHIRKAMHLLWPKHADSYEYELCQLLSVDSLSDYISDINGFFAYHYARYIKGPKLNPRRAPIYWPLSSRNGAFTLWVYYPKLTQNTLPQIVLLLGRDIETAKSELVSAQINQDKITENRLRLLLSDLDDMVSDLNAIISLPYRPNHCDGVPVTAAPLAKFFHHPGWRNECLENLEKLNKGEYDWSHLAFSMFPLRIRELAKKDWCMALTHGLEELCLNRPKQKKKRKVESVSEETPNLFD